MNQETSSPQKAPTPIKTASHSSQTPPKALSHKHAATILLVEGAVSVAVQFIVLRQLSTFVGSSVVTTSIVISCFLLALAVGYEQGGKLKRAQPDHLARNFLLAALGLGLGLSYWVLEQLFNLAAAIGIPDQLSTLLYSALLMGPCVYWLGQTVPLLLNHHIVSRNQAEAPARLAGTSLKLSTLGNVVGGLVSTLVVMYFFGVAAALSVNALFLLALWFSLTPQRTHAVVGLFLACGIISLNLGYEHYRFDASTAYGHYKALTIDDDKHWIINNRSDSKLTENGLGHDYIEQAKGILFDQLKLRDHDILLLGAGGFSFSYERPYNNRFSYVDIDGQLKALAEEFFLGEQIKGAFEHSDARAFVRQAQQSGQRFHAAFLDTFSHRYAIPEHLMTVEFFTELANIIEQDGKVIINVIANPLMNDRYSQRVHNTLHKAFGHCAMWYEAYVDSLQNLLYSCRVEHREHEHGVYRDGRINL